MTCVVGLVDNGTVYMGADSLAGGASGWDMRLRADPKVFRVGPMLIGHTTSYRLGQLLRFNLRVPNYLHIADASEDDFFIYLVGEFIDAARACFKEGGYAKVEHGREEAGLFLVGHAGRLYTIDSDFHVGIPLDPFAAIGCGDQLAHGALYATLSVTGPIPPRHRVQLALEAAERFSAGVRGPFVIEELRS